MSSDVQISEDTRLKLNDYILRLPSVVKSSTSTCYVVKTCIHAGGDGLQTKERDHLSDDTPQGMKERIERTTAIIEVPSTDHLDSLTSKTQWLGEHFDEGIDLFVWIVGKDEIVEDTRFCNILSRFKTAKHIVSSADFCPDYLAMTSASISASQYMTLDPERNRLRFDNEPIKSLPEALAEMQCSAVVVAKPGALVNFGDKKQLLVETNRWRPLDVQRLRAIVPAKAVEFIKQRLRANTTHTATSTSDVPLPCPDAEIIFLGTGSGTVTWARRPAGMILRVPGSGSYLFDAGDGTLGQLRRMFPREMVEEILCDLRMVFVSHEHDDHVHGLPAIIEERLRIIQSKHADFPRPSVPVLSRKDLLASLQQGRHLVMVCNEQVANFVTQALSMTHESDYGVIQLDPTSNGDLQVRTIHENDYWFSDNRGGKRTM